MEFKGIKKGHWGRGRKSEREHLCLPPQFPVLLNPIQVKTKVLINQKKKKILLAHYNEIVDVNLKTWPKKDPLIKLNHDLKERSHELAPFVIYRKAKDIDMHTSCEKTSFWVQLLWLTDFHLLHIRKGTLRTTYCCYCQPHIWVHQL